MGSGTAISLVIGIVALIAMVAFYTNDQVDKKIQKAITSPEVLSQLAKQIQLPFIIIDEKGIYRYEHNAIKLIESIDIKIDGENELKSIKIIPKTMLTIPPIIEAINFSMEFSEPTQERPYSWIFTPAESEVAQLVCGAVQKPDPAKKLIRQFKITLIAKGN
ncbi:MAG: hypothetical protein U9N63_09950 [Pseudomonadota bacterium]|nr:hypothetical protein [Pseudomonadota bacterium]